MTEFTFINDLRRKLRPSSKLLIPPGDDAAELAVGAKSLLLAADMLLDGVHFRIADCGGALAGRKALAVNLSDVAAMAGTPTACLVSLALPRAGGMALAHAVSDGIAALAAEFGVDVAGGDTNAWDGPLVINVAIIGEPHAKGSVRRSGARPGDAVFVTGRLGGSIRGRHLTFTPRVEAARALHERFGLTAMIDLSDGLAGDLRHILVESGVAARLDRAAIPVNDGATIAGALADGEDFELCFTLPASAAAALENSWKEALPVTRIGVIAAGPAGHLAFTDGAEIAATGYAHAFR